MEPPTLQSRKVKLSEKALRALFTYHVVRDNMTGLPCEIAIFRRVPLNGQLREISRIRTWDHTVEYDAHRPVFLDKALDGLFLAYVRAWVACPSTEAVSKGKINSKVLYNTHPSDRVSPLKHIHALPLGGYST